MMDRSPFIMWCLLGIGVALAVLLPLGPKRRACISPPAWWFCMVVGSVVCFYGMAHSTAPSFAPQVTVVGKATAFEERRYGRESKLVFGFVPEGGNPVDIETHIVVPHWGNDEMFDRRTLRITYLNDTSRSVSNEAVDIAILSGPNSGWHDSLDARPFGIWLAIPIGAGIAGFGYMGIRYRKDDLKAAESSETMSSISGA